MNKYNTITVLGSGTSTGIPMIGCTCAVCQSSESKNKRLRTSFLIETKSNKKILIDVTPDFRTQALREKIMDIDFCILTHDHADHLHGIDDLRPFCFGPPTKTINIYTHQDCLENTTSRFPYIFNDAYYNEDKPVLGGGIPKLKLNAVKSFFKFQEIEGENFCFFMLPHGHGHTLGLIYDKMAIAIDCHEIPEKTLDFLAEQNLEILFIDCVKEGEHKTHLTLDKSLKYAQKIKAKKSYLIHMSHHLEHNELASKCAAIEGLSIAPSFDSMRVNF